MTLKSKYEQLVKELVANGVDFVRGNRGLRKEIRSLNALRGLVFPRSTNYV